MEEAYTADVAERDEARSRFLLASLSPAGRIIASELMEISRRAGEASGSDKAARQGGDGNRLRAKPRRAA